MANNPFDFATQTSLNTRRVPDPFQQSFRSLGLGGKAQQAHINQLGKRREESADIAAKKLMGEREKMMAQIQKAKAETATNINEQREDLQSARQFAQEDVKNQIDQMMTERNRIIQDLERRREELRRSLQDVVSQEQLSQQVGAFDDIIGGLTQGALSIAQMGGRNTEYEFGESQVGPSLSSMNMGIENKNLAYFTPPLSRPTPAIQTPLFGEGVPQNLLQMAPPQPQAYYNSQSVTQSLMTDPFAKYGITLGAF